MFCENCGTQLPDDSAFCSECGSKISSSGNETQTNEESINISNESGTQGQRGAVPPVMRQTAPRQPAAPYGKETAMRQAPRQPAEPYRRETTPRRPFEPYRRETGLRQTSESYMGGTADIISFGQYVGMIFLAGIPIINIILLIKWGLNKQKPNKSNFAKALLFYYLIAVIIYALYIRLWLKVTSGI